MGMGHRSLWLFAFAVLAAIALLLWRSCARDETPTASVQDPAAPASIAASDDPSASTAIAAQTAASRKQRAMSAAVDTVHRYLTALSSGDRAKADAFWVNDRPPAQSNEADLRTLKEVRAVRIQNRAPKPLDSNPVPEALEVPVELRASADGISNRQYRGWYRLRSLDPVNGEWEISSASISREAP